tara:strand:- start:85 stop:513 length:429 start_codon:yes stop_codon:yes gene_type:complete
MNKLQWLKKEYKKLIHSKFINIKKQIKCNQGVYIVKDGKKIIYVGKSVDLKTRLNFHISKSGKSSSLRTALSKGYKTRKNKRGRYILKKKCKWAVTKVEDYDDCNLLEAYTILKCRTDDLLNEIKTNNNPPINAQGSAGVIF